MRIMVSDFNTTDEMLNKLGYFARSRQENRRIRYVLDDVEIDIDFWPLIPAYVEFEGKSEEAIRNLCKNIDVDFESLVSIDVERIYAHYGINFSSLPPIITLEDSVKNLKFNA